VIFADYPGHFFIIAFLVVTAGLVVLAFHCRQMQTEKNRPYRLLLMGLRYSSIIILLLILCNPSHFALVDVVARNSVLALFDTSQSFSVEDVGTDRLDKAIKIFEERFHPSNTNGPEYKIFGFDSQVYHCGSTQLLRRWGNQTDIESVLATLAKHRTIRSDNRDSPKPADSNEYMVKSNNNRKLPLSKVSGAVVFTDGQAEKIDTTYLPFVGDSFPIIIIGIGSRDKNIDIAIQSINAPTRVIIDSIYNVKVVVAAENLKEGMVDIELFKDDKQIDSKQIEAEQFLRNNRDETSNVSVEFTIGADSLGSHSLSARARKIEREVNWANNVRGTMVEVIEADKINVLFYTQAANFNVGKLRQTLIRDSRIQLDFGLDAIKTLGLSSVSSKQLGYVKLPENREEFNEYDIIILGHCMLDNLIKEQIDGLYNFVVQRGGGLILLPGRGDFGPGEWKNQKLRALLPVIFEDDSKLWPPNPCKVELTPEGLNSQIFTPDDFQIDGSEISAFYRIARVKPVADTVATSDGIPLISIHRVGRGRVCLLNISRLFMWYREDKQGGLLYKLISGLVSRLGKIPQQTAGVELFVERSNARDDKVTFSAYVCDGSFNPIEQANVLLKIDEHILTMEPVGRGYYVIESNNPEEDTVIATAQAEIGGVFLGEKTVAVNLPPRRTEMSDTRLNEKFLQTLAEQIKGTYMHADDIQGDMGKMFDSKTHLGTAQSMTSIWPSWFLLALLCVILSLEWFLRRAKGLM
jgi:hypothetical protein